MTPSEHTRLAWITRRARMDEALIERVDSSSGPDGCWLWTGSHQTGHRYGTFIRNGKIRYAHRWMLERKLGRPLAPGEEAIHSCDNPPCVNPAHLSVGSHADNMADMARKLRGPRKLTPLQVAAIRTDRTVSSAEFARRFGVTSGAVQHIRSGLNWRAA